jgi:phosphoglycolate phosphatase
MIAGLVFDKDGTLFDFNATWGSWTRQMVLQEAAGDPALADVLAQALGFDMVAGQFLLASVVIASTIDDVADVILNVTGQRDKPRLIARMNAASAQVRQVPAVPLQPFVTQLRGLGLTLGLATNDAQSSALRHLNDSGIAADFAFVAGYDSGFGAKPGPGQLHEFCARTGLAAAACAMVGDSLHDMHAGRAAGMMCIGVLTGPAPRAELEGQADIVLPDIAAIPDWLRAQGLLA